LKLDERWKSQMKERDKFVVTALTSPWLSTYGYPLHANGIAPTGVEVQNAGNQQDRRCEPLL
jgi:hypothetical protein